MDEFDFEEYLRNYVGVDSKGQEFTIDMKTFLPVLKKNESEE